MRRRSRIAVVGLGGIGGVAADCLAATRRHEVVACVRRPIQTLTLEAPGGSVEVLFPVLNDPAQALPAEWVLLCTKTHQTEAAAPWLKRLCAPSTRRPLLRAVNDVPGA